MELTVLGKSPSWQDAGGAASGYLIRAEGYTVMLECGSGTFAKLRREVDYVDVDAVLVSHLHADHFFDLVPYSYALLAGPRAGARRPQLHVPPGAGACLARLGGCLGDEQLIDSAFALHEYDATRTLELGPFTAAWCEVPHYVPTHAVALTGPGGERFTFGADCRPNQALVELASGTDLLMIEATLTASHTAGSGGHLSAREAGEHGRQAGARRVVLTHFSDELDPDRLAAEGAAGYGAPVELAREGAVYRL